MKNCHKYMIIGCLVLLGAVLILPQFGVSLPSSSLLFGILMIGCCVLPMVLAATKVGGSSCCSKDKAEKAKATSSEPSKSCH